MTDFVAGGVPVWALLIERGVDEGSDLRLFGQRSDAEAAARNYLSERWLDDPGLASDTDDAIEQYNGDPTGGEHVFLGRVRIEGKRSRCQICGEPIALVDEDDPDSWVHTEDANDGADHTAVATGRNGRADYLE